MEEEEPNMQNDQVEEEEEEEERVEPLPPIPLFGNVEGPLDLPPAIKVPIRRIGNTIAEVNVAKSAVTRRLDVLDNVADRVAPLADPNLLAPQHHFDGKTTEVDNRYRGWTLPRFIGNKGPERPLQQFVNYLGNFNEDFRVGGLNVPVSLRDAGHHSILIRDEDGNIKGILPSYNPELQEVNAPNSFGFLWHTLIVENRVAHPTMSEANVMKAAIRDLQRIRYADIRYLLRGGHANFPADDAQPTSYEVAPLGERFVRLTENPPNLRFDPQEGEETEGFRNMERIILLKQWAGSHINIRNIPPIISQVAFSYFFDWIVTYRASMMETLAEFELSEAERANMDEAIAFDIGQEELFIRRNDVITGAMRTLSDGLFKLPIYLSQSLERLLVGLEFAELEVYIEGTYLVMDYKEGYMRFWKTVGAFHRLSPGNTDLVIMQHFELVHDQLLEMQGKYETENGPAANLPETTLYFANFRIYPINVDDDLLLEAQVNRAFTLFPIDDHLRHGKYQPILSAGICIAEALYWVKRSINPPLEDKRVYLPAVRKDFIEWMKKLPEASIRSIYRGELGFLRREIEAVGLKWQLLDVECWTYTVGENKDLLPVDCREESWVKDTFDPSSPIFVFSAFHVFEVTQSGAFDIIKSRTSPKWVTDPWVPHKEKNKKEEGERKQKATKKRQSGIGKKRQPAMPEEPFEEEISADDVATPIDRSKRRLHFFMDIESLRQGDIQVPYIIVVKERGKQPRVFRKRDMAHDIVADLRLWLFQEFVEPWHRMRRQKVKLLWDSLVFWTHNGTGYDLIFIIDPQVLANSRFFGDPDKPKAFIWGPITFADFMNFFKGSLESISKEWFGDDERYKKKVHVDFDSITPETFLNDIEMMIEYCIQDVEILERCVEYFLTTIDGVEINGVLYSPKSLITASSLGMDIFLTCFNDYYVYPLTKEQHSRHVKMSETVTLDDGRVVRGGGAYAGGMTMTLHQRCGPAFMRDVVSSYPNAMMREQPVKFLRLVEFKHPVSYENIPPATSGTIRLFRITKWRLFRGNPLCHLAIHTKDGLFYVHENDDETWRWEIELHDIVHKFRLGYFEVTGYEEWEAKPLFKNYVEYWFNIKNTAKKEKKPGLCAFAKLMLNSLYGKTAQKQYSEKFFGPVPRIAQIMRARGFSNVQHVKKILDWVLVTMKTKEDITHCGAWKMLASHITACARHTLWSAAHQIGAHNVVYMDTDSIVSLEDLPRPLCEPEGALGTWELEGIVEEGHFYAPKHYYIKFKEGTAKNVEKMKFKGIPQKMVTKEMFDHDYKDGANPQVIKDIEIFRKLFYGESGKIAVIKMDKCIRGHSVRRRFITPHYSLPFKNMKEAQSALKQAFVASKKGREECDEEQAEDEEEEKEEKTSVYHTVSLKKMKRAPTLFYNIEPDEIKGVIRRIGEFLTSIKITINLKGSVKDMLQQLLSRDEIPEAVVNIFADPQEVIDLAHGRK